jgi:hypothetical protein
MNEEIDLWEVAKKKSELFKNYFSSPHLFEEMEKITGEKVIWPGRDKASLSLWVEIACLRKEMIEKDLNMRELTKFNGDLLGWEKGKQTLNLFDILPYIFALGKFFPNDLFFCEDDCTDCDDKDIIMVRSPFKGNLNYHHLIEMWKWYQTINSKVDFTNWSLFSYDAGNKEFVFKRIMDDIEEISKVNTPVLKFILKKQDAEAEVVKIETKNHERIYSIKSGEFVNQIPESLYLALKNNLLKISDDLLPGELPMMPEPTVLRETTEQEIEGSMHEEEISESFKPDEMDLKILERLKDNVKPAIIAKGLNKRPSYMHYRLKRLEKHGIVKQTAERIWTVIE